MMSIFDEYILRGNPSQRELAETWRTAIGLQAVDGLHVSEFLLQTALRNIKGEITIDEVQEIIDRHYENKKRLRLEEKTSEKKQETSEKSVTQSAIQSANSARSLPSKCKNCTLDEVVVLRLIQVNPRMTQKQLAAEIRKSEHTVKTITTHLVEMGVLRRDNGKRDGYWTILYDEDKE